MLLFKRQLTGAVRASSVGVTSPPDLILRHGRTLEELRLRRLVPGTGSLLLKQFSWLPWAKVERRQWGGMAWTPGCQLQVWPREAGGGALQPPVCRPLQGPFCPCSSSFLSHCHSAEGLVLSSLLNHCIWVIQSLSGIPRRRSTGSTQGQAWDSLCTGAEDCVRPGPSRPKRTI